MIRRDAPIDLPLMFRGRYSAIGDQLVVWRESQIFHGLDFSRRSRTTGSGLEGGVSLKGCVFHRHT